MPEIFIHVNGTTGTIAAAVVYEKHGDHYYGWYAGYCGNGCEDERFFKLSSDFTEFRASINGEFWDGFHSQEILEKEFELMENARLKLSDDYFDPDAQELLRIAPHVFKNCIKETNDAGEEIYYFKTREFSSKLLASIGAHWCLTRNSGWMPPQRCFFPERKIMEYLK